MKEKLWTGKKRYIIVGVIVALLVFIVGAIIITSLDNVLQQQNIDYMDGTVTNKYMTNQSNHFYVVVDENGNTYDIINSTKGGQMYDTINIGSKYHFVIKKPLSHDDNYIHIIQVYNATN